LLLLETRLDAQTCRKDLEQLALVDRRAHRTEVVILVKGLCEHSESFEIRGVTEVVQPRGLARFLVQVVD